MATSRGKWTNLVWALLWIVSAPLILFRYIFLNACLNRRLFLFLAIFSTGCCYRECIFIVRQINAAVHTYILNSVYSLITLYFIFFLKLAVYFCYPLALFARFYSLAELLQILDMINGNRFPIIQMLFYPLSLIAAFLTHSIVLSWWPVSPQ